MSQLTHIRDWSGNSSRDLPANHPGVSTPPGACLSPTPTIRSCANTRGRWELDARFRHRCSARSTRYRVVATGPDMQPHIPEQTIRLVFVQRHPTYSRRISRNTVDTDRPNTTAICRTDYPALRTLLDLNPPNQQQMIVMYTHRNTAPDSANTNITKCCASTLNTGTSKPTCRYARLMACVFVNSPDRRDRELAPIHSRVCTICRYEVQRGTPCSKRENICHTSRLSGDMDLFIASMEKLSWGTLLAVTQ